MERGARKFLEALYVAWWYIGPVSGLAAFDFIGATQGAIARGMPSIYLGAAAALLGLAALGRARHIRR